MRHWPSCASRGPAGEEEESAPTPGSRGGGRRRRRRCRRRAIANDTGFVHPIDPVSTRPNTMPPTPTVQVTAPIRSKWPSWRPSRRARRGRASHTPRPMGTLTNMTQRHDTKWVRRPPATSPGRATGSRDGGVQADGAHPRGTLGKDGGEEGERAGRSERGTHALDGSGGQEGPAAHGQTADQGAQREDGDPEEEDSASAEEVAGPGPEEQESAEGEDVGVDDPRQRARREIEALLDVRERDVHDRRVEHHHELGRQDHGEEDRGTTASIRSP